MYANGPRLSSHWGSPEQRTQRAHRNKSDQHAHATGVNRGAMPNSASVTEQDLGSLAGLLLVQSQGGRDVQRGGDHAKATTVPFSARNWRRARQRALSHQFR